MIFKQLLLHNIPLTKGSHKQIIRMAAAPIPACFILISGFGVLQHMSLEIYFVKQ